MYNFPDDVKNAKYVISAYYILCGFTFVHTYSYKDMVRTPPFSTKPVKYIPIVDGTGWATTAITGHIN